jgi:hypothetical protein
MKIAKFLSVLIVLSFALAGCQDYGKKVTKGPIEVYYKDGITEEQAQHTANMFAYIDSMQNNNTKNTKSMQLCKKKDELLFRMVAEKDKLGTVPDESFFIIGNIVSDSIFHGAPVTVELTNNKFETFKTFPYKKMDLGGTPETPSQETTPGTVQPDVTADTTKGEKTPQ